MEGGNRRLWPFLKQRLSWKRINILGCCGSSKWVIDTTAGEQPLIVTGDQIMAGDGTTTSLATALAADRRKMNVGPTDGIIVRLFEIEDRDVKAAEGGGGGVGTLCCLCTDRYKGAALIPCGHTYCRVCSRAMWLKQESCPLCNRSITEILEIF